jgi:DNA-binding CsgD family transcriptional regulator
VFVHNQPACDESLVTTLATIFRLTGAEARILAAMLEGQSISEVARRYKISASTARTHLQRLFAKTNNHRQSDLIRHATNAIPPLRAGPRVESSDQARDRLHGSRPGALTWRFGKSTSFSRRVRNADL